MEIYIVQPGDSIDIIANKYNMSVEKLVSDNGLINANNLVTGQALVILYPQETYIVKQGDTLDSIAEANGISLMQLIRNSPFLYDRNFIYPGEPLVLSYSTERELQVNGYSYAFINQDILKKTLPYLTYLSIFNYRIIENAQIANYGDDTEIINITKSYQTQPLLMISAYSPTGEIDIDYVYVLLLNEEHQDRLVKDMVQIVREKGFFGINALISRINKENQYLYLNVLTKLSKALHDEGYIFMLTINPNLDDVNRPLSYEDIDYKSISLVVDRLIILKGIFGINKQPPSPVSNISSIRSFIDYLTSQISPDILSIGKPLIGYDWSLPYTPGSSARSMSLISAITLAYEQRALIELDEESQTPYYNYTSSYVGPPQSHVVWFIDARSIVALDDVIIDYGLVGSGAWNIITSNQQVWSIINARFSIVKLQT